MKPETEGLTTSEKYRSLVPVTEGLPTREFMDEHYLYVRDSGEYLLGESPTAGFDHAAIEVFDMESLRVKTAELIFAVDPVRVPYGKYDLDVPAIDVIWQPEYGDVFVSPASLENEKPSRFRGGHRFFRAMATPQRKEGKEIDMVTHPDGWGTFHQVPALDDITYDFDFTEFILRRRNAHEHHLISKAFAETNRDFDPEAWRRLTDQLFALYHKHGLPKHGSEIVVYRETGEADTFRYVADVRKQGLSMYLGESQEVLYSDNPIDVELWAARFGNRTRVYRYQNGREDTAFLCIPKSRVHSAFKDIPDIPTNYTHTEQWFCSE